MKAGKCLHKFNPAIFCNSRAPSFKKLVDLVIGIHKDPPNRVNFGFVPGQGGTTTQSIIQNDEDLLMAFGKSIDWGELTIVINFTKPLSLKVVLGEENMATFGVDSISYDSGDVSFEKLKELSVQRFKVPKEIVVFNAASSDGKIIDNDTDLLDLLHNDLEEVAEIAMNLPKLNLSFSGKTTPENLHVVSNCQV
mmetsp:Transcript_1037/g.1379  ORF Transcript_1037/g.1379 Transcript_1037/m.1379 type:complete len:194 (+) Transcript_1037:89-670(+)